MIGAVAALLFSQAVSGHDTVLNGRCDYSEQIVERSTSTVFALCDTVAIKRDGRTSAFIFTGRGSGNVTRFEGLLEGDVLEISQVRVAGRKPVSATGRCEIFYLDEEVSVVACLATARNRSYAANFVRKRL